MGADTPEQLHHLLAAAFNAGDVDAAVALYEPDARLIVPPDGRPARGAAEIRAAILESSRCNRRPTCGSSARSSATGSRSRTGAGR